MRNRPIEQINTRASHQWPRILIALAPQRSSMIKRGTKQGSCALCGGKDRARCHDDFNEISLPPIEIPKGQKYFDWLDYLAQGKKVSYG